MIEVFFHNIYIRLGVPPVAGEWGISKVEAFVDILTGSKNRLKCLGAGVAAN